MYTIDSPFLNLQQSSIDWLYRYEPILDFLVVHELLNADILDYGCGNIGLGSVFNGKYFGIDINPIVPEVANLTPIHHVHPYDLEKTFDVVCAVDVLEHIPLPERGLFFMTMRRITRRHLILTFPTREAGYQLDVETGMFLDSQGRLPDWLLEHLSLQHPGVDEIVKLACDSGFKMTSRLMNTHRIMHYLGCIGIHVSGPLKVKLLNEIHYLNVLHSQESALDMYRAILFLEVA